MSSKTRHQKSFSFTFYYHISQITDSITLQAFLGGDMKNQVCFYDDLMLYYLLQKNDAAGCGKAPGVG